MLFLLISASASFAVAACLWFQPDFLAAVTLVPYWFWPVAGILLAICGYRREHRRAFTVVLIIWIVFTVVFVEQCYSVLRITHRSTTDWQAIRTQGRGIRVISLNCGMGQFRSVEEAVTWTPDIVLLQESPSREKIEQLCQTLFGPQGSYLAGGDTSILARGKIEAIEVPGCSYFTCARIELTNGLSTYAVSVRLDPPVFRIDFWKSGFWHDHRRKRTNHREQIIDMLRIVESFIDAPFIVGGDFNSPAGDGALTPLEDRFIDTFCQGGKGWGGTGPNEYPLFRVDQIWATADFRADSVIAQKSLHSDHRMVVCDLLVTDRN